MSARTMDHDAGVGQMIPEQARKDAAKAAAKPAAKPAAKQPGSSAAKSGKQSGAGFASGLFLGLLLMLIVAAVAFTAVWLNLGGAKDQVIAILDLEQSAQANIDSLRTELAAQQDELAKQQAELTIKENDLASRETKISAQEKSIQEQLNAITDNQAAEQAILDNQAELVAIYEAMEPAKLAAALTASQDFASHLPILIQMNQVKLSKVLGEMNATDAAKLLKALSNQG
jgi:flagellar motility protein MotE (MotC chaperone)